MEKDQENIAKLREIYEYYKDDPSSLPILLYRCIRMLEFREKEKEVKAE